MRLLIAPSTARLRARTSNTFTLYVDHQYASPYAMSAFVTLVEKGIDFELRTLNLAAGEH